MKVALLVCDHIREELVHIDGEYPHMFARLFPEVSLDPYWVCDGHFPASVEDYEVYICSGSKFSVYDDEPWIKDLNQFVGDVYKAGKRYLGICFGHQMMAQALGGQVEKATRGWTVGVHQFEVNGLDHWMDPDMEHFRLLLMCQDQVVRIPDSSTIHASSDHCPVGVFSLDQRFLGIQAHPEFSKEYHKALLTGRSEQIGDQLINQALNTMSTELSTKEIVRWMMNFLRQ